MSIKRTNPQIEDRIKRLFKKLSEHTQPVCATQCARPQSCCGSFYCEMTIQYAKTHWNVDLPRTDHPTLPMMGPNGCTADPHLRPLCTFHVCCVDALGYKPNDPEWTKKYFDLRGKVVELERWRSDYTHPDEEVKFDIRVVDEGLQYAKDGLTTPTPTKVEDFLKLARQLRTNSRVVTSKELEELRGI